MHFSFIEIIASFMVFFAIIDIPGSIPVILNIKAKTGEVNAAKATLVSLSIFLPGIEMVLGAEFFKMVLRMTSFFERLLGPTGLNILKKFFGIIFIAIAVRLFIHNTGIILPHA